MAKHRAPGAPEDMLDHIGDEADLIVPSRHGEPVGVIEAIEANAHRWTGVRINLITRSTTSTTPRDGEDRLVSINASTEVDLVEQCASETVRGRYSSSSGGKARLHPGSHVLPARHRLRRPGLDRSCRHRLTHPTHPDRWSRPQRTRSIDSSRTWRRRHAHRSISQRAAALIAMADPAPATSSRLEAVTSRL